MGYGRLPLVYVDVGNPEIGQYLVVPDGPVDLGLKFRNVRELSNHGNGGNHDIESIAFADEIISINVNVILDNFITECRKAVGRIQRLGPEPVYGSGHSRSGGEDNNQSHEQGRKYVPHFISP